MKNLVDKLGISNQVVFVGVVAHDDVYEYFMISDVFLSLYDLSNMGNPLFEAMCLKKCIITLDVGDTKAIIKNNENTILLDYSEIDILNTYMEELITNEQKRMDLGINARKTAERTFTTWEKRLDIEFKKIAIY